MKRHFATLLMLTMMAAAVPAHGFESRFLHALADTEYERVESEIIGRGFHIYVKLPAGYADNPEAHYPTIYLLDGGSLFPLMASYYRLLNFSEEIPDAIIVGISYGSDTYEGGNYRSTDYTAPSTERDYWGGAGDFQRFLSDELLPRIEAKYRSRADRRVVFGQSIGGQFVLYTALTRPQLFWGHVASNPALHRNLEFFLQTHGDVESLGDSSKLYVGSGALDDPRFREPAVAWIEHWSQQTATPWQLKTMSLDGHTHMSTPPAAFRQGMAWLFAGD